jgi:hypothetical protein
MKHRKDHSNPAQQRALIASAAARLIAEDGVSDYGSAKRKAARGLGLPENSGLPDDSEVETELRIRQRLFQADEQDGRIRNLRTIAAEIMQILLRFNVYLTGSVADGSAGRHAEIDLQLFPDSAKDVEIFLLNSNIDFKHSVPRSDRAEAVLSLDREGVVVNLVVYPLVAERMAARTRDGRPRERLRLPALRALLADSGEHQEDCE